MPEMHLKQPGFTYNASVSFTKIREKKIKHLYKQEIQIIFTKMILVKVVFNMTWLMVNIKI